MMKREYGVVYIYDFSQFYSPYCYEFHVNLNHIYMTFCSQGNMFNMPSDSGFIMLLPKKYVFVQYEK